MVNDSKIIIFGCLIAINEVFHKVFNGVQSRSVFKQCGVLWTVAKLFSF